jgi:ribosomal protein S18 acetylase RimI-like enzyme
MNIMDLNVTFRKDVRPSDRTTVRMIVEATGYFSGAETEMAVELVEECLSKGEASGYHFLFVEFQGAVIGYAVYGPCPATLHSYDIYWMAVYPDFQGQGIGRKLLAMCESLIQEKGGRQIYMDTSGRAQYEPTRQLYVARGYLQAAYLPDYYAPGDAKITYVKVIA